MIALFNLIVLLLSFTRAPMWLLVTLVLIPSAGISVFMHDAAITKAAVLALAGALALYAPMAFIGSYFTKGGFRLAFRRLRFVYFVWFNLLFVVLVFNLPQLVVGSSPT
jgi:hypothetical protein